MSLEGLIIGVPAARRATETAALIERWGGKALVGPVMEEVPVSDEEPVLEATRQVIDSGPAWSVHLTGVGTKRWFDAAARGGLLDPLLATLAASRLIPRGAKANGVLRSHSLEAAWIPEGETSAEIAEWLAPQIETGDTVALQRHGEPVPGLSGPLEAAGAHIIDLITYRWEIPADRGPAERLVNALISREVHALVITSAPQMRLLFEVAGGIGHADALRQSLAGRVYLAAVGHVAAAALEAEKLKPDLIADPPRLGALIRALAADREGIVAKNKSWAESSTDRYDL